MYIYKRLKDDTSISESFVSEEVYRNIGKKRVCRPEFCTPALVKRVLQKEKKTLAIFMDLGKLYDKVNRKGV